jgi:hypothetical protein
MNWVSAIAPPGQEGWMCHKENNAKQPLSAQTGWLFKLIKTFEQPPRPLVVDASRLF